MKNSTYSEYVSNLHVKCAFYLFLYETAEIPREEKKKKKQLIKYSPKQWVI